jgi:hypothetical protein
MQRRDEKHNGVVELFVSALGWAVPRRFEHTVSTSATSARCRGIVFYESGCLGDPRTDCFLQVNQLAVRGTHLLLSAAVYAIRYRICTGWHAVEIPVDADKVLDVAAKMSRWLGRQNFDRYESRREFRVRHPETADYSWSRIRQLGPPYYVVVAKHNGRLSLKQRKSETCKRAMRRRSA